MGKEIRIGNVYWNQEKGRWYSIRSQEESEIDQFQVEMILNQYGIALLAEHFPADVLATTSPAELEEECTQAAIVSFGGEIENENSINIFWDQRKNTWMEDIVLNDGEKHERSPTELSNDILDDFFQKLRLFNLYNKTDANDLRNLHKRIIHMPLEELKKFNETY